MKMQCGHILWFMEDAAYLCTLDFGHKGACDNPSINKMLLTREPVEFVNYGEV